jgi:hypothetical protein
MDRYIIYASLNLKCSRKKRKGGGKEERQGKESRENK